MDNSTYVTLYKLIREDDIDQLIRCFPSNLSECDGNLLCSHSADYGSMKCLQYLHSVKGYTFSVNSLCGLAASCRYDNKLLDAFIYIWNALGGIEGRVEGWFVDHMIKYCNNMSIFSFILSHFPIETLINAYSSNTYYFQITDSDLDTLVWRRCCTPERISMLKEKLTCIKTDSIVSNVTNLIGKCEEKYRGLELYKRYTMSMPISTDVVVYCIYPYF